ncbi:MAG: hypothetical protein UY47_C0004G0008 [Parcubacteria group bacterium GW2011_GWB1_49_7]|nr:MAG: hypothetical protein UX71_C0002G0104 [Parcubacteria group bacterium GW2011_GWA1_47_10]KKW09834.1 MAG: hypothetical protein UY47_C0004G0008 [Parcubacteria group bacterium GW2011_GWB1_49_7]
MVLGEVGKDFAVEGDVRLLQHRDELGVGNAVLFEESRHADVPEATEVALLVLPMGEGICAGVEDGFVCHALLG